MYAVVGLRTLLTFASITMQEYPARILPHCQTLRPHCVSYVHATVRFTFGCDVPSDCGDTLVTEEQSGNSFTGGTKVCARHDGFQINAKVVGYTGNTLALTSQLLWYRWNGRWYVQHWGAHSRCCLHVDNTLSVDDWQLSPDSFVWWEVPEAMMIGGSNDEDDYGVLDVGVGVQFQVDFNAKCQTGDRYPLVSHGKWLLQSQSEKMVIDFDSHMITRKRKPPIPFNGNCEVVGLAGNCRLRCAASHVGPDHEPPLKLSWPTASDFVTEHGYNGQFLYNATHTYDCMLGNCSKVPIVGAIKRSALVQEEGGIFASSAMMESMIEGFLHTFFKVAMSILSVAIGWAWLSFRSAISAIEADVLLAIGTACLGYVALVSQLGHDSAAICALVALAAFLAAAYASAEVQ